MTLTLQLCKENNGGLFFDEPITRLGDGYGYFVNLADSDNEEDGLMTTSGDLPKQIGSSHKEAHNFGGFYCKGYAGTIVFDKFSNAKKWFDFCKNRLENLLGVTIKESVEQ